MPCPPTPFPVHILATPFPLGQSQPIPSRILQPRDRMAHLGPHVVKFCSGIHAHIQETPPLIRYVKPSVERKPRLASHRCQLYVRRSRLVLPLPGCLDLVFAEWQRRFVPSISAAAAPSSSLMVQLLLYHPLGSLQEIPCKVAPPLPSAAFKPHVTSTAGSATLSSSSASPFPTHPSSVSAARSSPPAIAARSRGFP